MKKILVIAIVLAAALAATAYISCDAATIWGKRIKGSDRIITKTIDTPTFDAIAASRSVRVIVADCEGETRIEANDNLMDWVVIEEENGTLQVTIDKSITSLSNVDVTVTLPGRGRAIRSLEASSAATIRSDIPLTGERTSLDASSSAEIETACESERCSVAASSAARIRARIQAGSCSFEASSAAKVAAKVVSTNCAASASSAANVTLEGEVGYLQADASSAGKVEAGGLTAERATAEASSGAGITLHCTNELEAEASSGGAIRYTGNCQLRAEKSSGGSIRHQ